jgi:hypothetical protein
MIPVSKICHLPDPLVSHFVLPFRIMGCGTNSKKYMNWQRASVKNLPWLFPRPGFIFACKPKALFVSRNSLLQIEFFRSRWGVKNNNQYNEDVAGTGATICPSEAGGWPTQPLDGKP